VAVAAGSAMEEVVGNAGLLFDPASEEVIASAMAHLLRDEGLRRDLGEKGLARAKRFSWDKTAEQTRALLRRLVGFGEDKS
jgi:glycosyltransferase involved in cell wall biosynthesis